MYYYIEEKLSKPRVKIDKDVRKMKVYETSGYGDKRVPKIKISGEWLERLGFNIGDEIDVKCENGIVTITLK
ncbi:MAG: SymE family type I addiction module toxin [Longicatena sp.]|nr:SymE family type I addiction module toxin [Longicatena sp.]